MDPIAERVDDIQASDDLLRELDKGIDDIEAGRFLPLDEAYNYVTRKRAERRNARLSSGSVV